MIIESKPPYSFVLLHDAGALAYKIEHSKSEIQKVIKRGRCHLVYKINTVNDSCKVLCGMTVSFSTTNSKWVTMDYHQIVKEIVSSTSPYNLCIVCTAHFMDELLPFKWLLQKQQQGQEHQEHVNLRGSR